MNQSDGTPVSVGGASSDGVSATANSLEFEIKKTINDCMEKKINKNQQWREGAKREAKLAEEVL